MQQIRVWLKQLIGLAIQSHYLTLKSLWSGVKKGTQRFVSNLIYFHRQRDEELLKRTTASIAHPVSQPQQQKVSRKHQALVAKKDERSKRFLKDSHILETNISKRQMDPSPSACLGNSEVAISIEPIVGTSDALEKPYLRLTSVRNN